MPSKIISIPLFLLAAWSVYLSISEQEVRVWGIIVPGILLGVIYVLSPQVDWFWYSRFPPDLPVGLVRMLEASTGPYRLFQEQEQVDFRRKTALFRMNLDFKGPAFDDKVPEDIQVAVAANAVLLMRHREDFLLPKFQVVVVYPNAFPSPQFPSLFHASELYEEDGVLLFSAQHLLLGFMTPERYYNVGLHEWAGAFVLSHPQLNWPVFKEGSWGKLEQISGYSEAWLRQYINRPEIELLLVAVVHYIHYREHFEALFPEEAAYFKLIFG